MLTFHNLSVKNYILFFIDSIFIFAAVYLAFILTPSTPQTLSGLDLVSQAIVTCFVCQLSFVLGELYKLEDKVVIGKLFISMAVSFLVLQIFSMNYPSALIGNPFLEYTLVLVFIAISIWRIVFIKTLNRLNLAKKIIIVGTGTNANLIAKELKQRSAKYNLLGFVSASGNNDSKTMGLKVLGKKTDIVEIVEEYGVNKLVVAFGERREKFPMEPLLKCKLSGIEVHEVHDFYEKVTGKILVEDLRPSWLIFSRGFRQTPFKSLLKRTFDIVLTLVSLVLAAPLFLITALLVKFEDVRAPVIFSQERTGKNNKVFTLYKFRSMRVDAESDSGPVWADTKDTRVTKVGGFIRATRLDELPQLINVLKGEMSLVGPRPERPFFIKKLHEAIPYYEQRHTVKPGVTGWAAVKFRYGSTVEDSLEKMQYDLYYIKNISILLDIKIIFLTIYVILSKQGSR